MAQRHLEKQIARTTGAAVGRTLLSWARASTAELAQQLVNETPDPRRALVLDGLVDRLNAGKREDALSNLARTASPSTKARVRRVYDAFLTRVAADLSSDGRHEEALRLVEQCLREQPQETVYYQNRAAIFTLLRESAPIIRLGPPQRPPYRLVLLGSFNRFTLSQIIKTHRLLRSRPAEERRRPRVRFQDGYGGKREKPRLVANIREMAADPDLLRQWIITPAPNSFFGMLPGRSSRLALLDPDDRDEAWARIEALGVLSDSLEVLVPEEGSAIAGLFQRRWRRWPPPYLQLRNAQCSCTRGRRAADSESDRARGRGEEEYTPGRDIEELLQEEHILTMADLCLICLQWPTGTGTALDRGRAFALCTRGGRIFWISK